MTLESDAKLEEKLTLENKLRNMTNFHQNKTRQSPKLTL